MLIQKEQLHMNEYDLIAPFYDIEHQQFNEDLDLYRNYAELCHGPLLELGCGSGRLLIPLAQEGYTITGADTSEKMLALARERSEQANLSSRVTLVQQDLTTLQLSQKFNMAFVALGSFAHLTSRKIQQQANADIAANVASGSYPVDAMVVIPCSVGTLARIANGIASQLIERAADVCLKEKRRLVLCVRETPLNKIHIRNMYRAADAGATVFPLIPAFYNRPSSVDVMAREFANRVLAHIGLRQPDSYRWKG